MTLEAELAPYDFALPSDRIAQAPAKTRDAARLLVLDRAAPDGHYEHAHIHELGRWLRAGDLLVINTTRVRPARLRGRRESGGAAEALLLGPADATPTDDPRPCLRALVKISGRVRVGIHFSFGPQDAGVSAEIVSLLSAGEVEIGRAHV